jgi:hypothetical protein
MRPPDTERSSGSWTRLEDHPLTAVLVALLGAAFGAFVLFFEWVTGPPWARDAFDDPETSAFVGQSETVLWLVMASAQAALWLVLLYPAVAVVRELRLDRDASVRGTWAGVALMRLIAVGFVAVAASVHGVDELPHDAAKFVCFVALGFVTSACAVVGLWQVHRALQGLTSQGGDHGEERVMRLLVRYDSRASNPIGGLLHLHELMHRALLVLGTALAGGILATGALRNALVAWDNRDGSGSQDAAFPLEHLLAYGLFFSVLLALIYAPVYSRYLKVGNTVLDGYTKLPAPGEAEWSDTLDQRTKLRDFLHLDVSPTANFQAAVAILAPLTSSLFAVLLPSE